MPRTAKTYSIEQIRKYTDRNGGNVKTWLPSTGNESEFINTFTLEGKNVVPLSYKDAAKTKPEVLGGSSKGEINTITEFGGKQNGASSINLDQNLQRYYLALYCLKVIEAVGSDPASSPAQDQITGFADALNVLSYSQDDKLFTDSFSYFLQQEQLGKAKGLTADVVRYYRGRKLSDPIKSEKDIQSLLDYAASSTEYRRNVTGVLGKVTYDSIVKNALYYLLNKEGFLTSLKISNNPFGWADEASKLGPDEIDYFIDPTGGPYSRAFPVVCVFTKAKSDQKLNDLIDKTNEFVSSKFLRNVTVDQLVTLLRTPSTQEPVGGEKNFIEKPNSTSGDSFYCLLYDFTKIIVLDPQIQQDYTLDIIKVCLSFLSRKRKGFDSVNEFTEYYLGISKYIKNEFGPSLEETDFIVKLKQKHAEECAYIYDKNASNYKAKLDQSFKAELKQILESLDNVYTQVIEFFNKETRGENKNFQFNKYSDNVERSIVLHYDNFYNLLAVTSYNLSEQLEKEKEYPKDSPFDLKQYESKYKYGDLVKQFFAEGKPPLPTIPANSSTPDYEFIKSFALYHDIALISDIFLKESFEILEPKKNSLVYENDTNAKQDKVLKADSIDILGLFKQRTDIDKNVKRGDVIYFSSNRYFLKKEILKTFTIKDFSFSFQATKEDKIKFQTINHLLFAVNKEIKKRKLSIDDFQEIIYYPLLNKITPTEKKREEAVKEQRKNADFLINNIISSELACYEDIANSFDKAINEDDPYDQLYYSFQTLSNIGLPILLALIADKISKRLQDLVKNRSDLSEDLLDCIQSDRDKIKKNILGYADLAANLNNPEQLLGYLTQGYFELPAIPAIPYITTFDAEKELKRRLVKFLIDGFIKVVKKYLDISLQSLKDMCNADSYLTAFLNSAIPNVDKSNVKKDFATQSGLPGSASPTIFIPQIIVNINILIQESNIQTVDGVYQAFREKYLVEYDNVKIANFFDYLSNAVDAGQMATLLNNSSTVETRQTLVSYIKNYEDKSIYDLVNDIASVSELFNFLSLYIDYRLCYGVISDSVNNFSGNICEDVNSKFGETALQFGEVAVEDEIADLTKILNQICSAKNQPSYDILLGGPLLITNGVKRSLGIGIQLNAESLNQHSQLVLEQLEENQTIEDPIKDIGSIGLLTPATIKYPNIIKESYINNVLNIFSDVLLEYYSNKEFLETFGNATKFNSYINKIAYDQYANYNQVFGTTTISEEDKIAFFKKVYQAGPKNENFKKAFNQKLDSVGNAGLKTEITTLNGYVRKLDQLNASKIKINTKV